jgi:transcriptional regulator with XRE-family HTH domain
MDSALKKYRAETKLTLTKLSADTGIGVAHLSKLERGLAGVSLPNAIKLAEATGLPVESFARQ